MLVPKEVLTMKTTAIWDNIQHCEGQTFATSKGQAFSYEVQDLALLISRHEIKLLREEIESAAQNFSYYAKDGRGSAAYINALLRDSRIRKP